MPFGWLQRISPFAFRTITLSQSVPDKTAHKKEGMPNGGLLPVCGKARPSPRLAARVATWEPMPALSGRVANDQASICILPRPVPSQTKGHSKCLCPFLMG